METSNSIYLNNIGTINTSTPSLINPTICSNFQMYPVNYNYQTIVDNYTVPPPDPYLGYHLIIDLCKQRCFKGIPMYKYRLTLNTPMPMTYRTKAWPLIIEGYEDWFFIDNIINDSTFTIYTPMHVLLKSNTKMAPLNQYDNTFTNEDLIKLVNT